MSHLIRHSPPGGPGRPDGPDDPGGADAPGGPRLPVPPAATDDSGPGFGTGTAAGTGFGVPGLAHPLLAPAEWNALTRPGGAGLLHWVVLDVADGPGVQPDPSCLEAVGRLRNAGVRVLGRLDAAHGLRDFGGLFSDAHRFTDWYRADGFLLDRCPADRAALPAVRRAVRTLRAIRDGAHIVLGHGTHPHPGHADIADQLVTFCGPWSDYRWSQVAEWTVDHPPERFCHLVHGVPRPHLEEALRVARWQGAATVWFTDRTDRDSRVGPWEPLPGYWDDIVSQVGTGVSE
ncbi:spherulation-specific family 4 protein [Streptomyces prasinopilosus]|uniref:Spherulation-specific family 4 n=1 Tax=Streptomyces prasinopilosus TaxID=67344 RepID=A0A1G6N9R8_9ACTN|nr:spherulation-specific family 4 protein [Streptomyces prasinopilosus]SDC63885.1 Spherulation-specific family 4 [Streptomyces prasinopilosus]